ncbi:hypothetical protein EI94DRAFT_1757209 [Lactarius quietus]|nr:hypothetical protein EI94DRAFT_1757209 [Lactarius quietus]
MWLLHKTTFTATNPTDTNYLLASNLLATGRRSSVIYKAADSECFRPDDLHEFHHDDTYRRLVSYIPRTDETPSFVGTWSELSFAI